MRWFWLPTLILTMAGAVHAEPQIDFRVRRLLDAANQPGFTATGDASIRVFIRGPVDRAALEAAGARVATSLPGLHTATLDPASLRRVLRLPGVMAVRGAGRLGPELDVSVPTTGASVLRGSGPAFTGVAGQGVLVGIVDSGIDIGHGDFLDASGKTRVVRLWDQQTPGPGPAGYGYGTEWTAAQIDAGSCTEQDVDGHGTHVLGIAAGDGSQTGGGVPAFTFTGMAPRADLAVVKTDYNLTSILDGIRWIFELAQSRSQNCVINVSLGTQEGPHDGTSDLEAGIAALAGPGRIVVKSAGNDRGLARHAQVNATASGDSITFFASGAAAGGILAVDGWYAGSERLRVRVRTPNNTVIGPVAIGGENAPSPGQSTANGSVYLAQDSLVTGVKNVHLEVTLATGQNLTGTWTVTFLADALGPTAGEVDLWRSGTTPGVSVFFQTGDQNEELISEPGNSTGVITVASWASRQSWTACNGTLATQNGTPSPGSLSTFSSPGPTRDGRQKPELAAPGENILSTTTLDLLQSCPSAPTPSVLAADGGNHVSNRGTSMSAPHVTGAIALLLQKRGALTPAEVASYLRSHALKDGFTGGSWSGDWGDGKLRLGDLVDPTIQALSPNGGEELIVGQPATITWNATDALGSVVSVDIELSRTGSAGPFEAIATVGNSGSYDWTVTGPPTAANQAFLRVRAHDSNDNVAADLSNAGFTVHSSTDTVPPATAFELRPLIPNPSPGPARIEFSLATRARIQLEVMDVFGRQVAVLADGEWAPGTHSVTWNLGGGVNSGLYFVRYTSPAGVLERRLALIR